MKTVPLIGQDYLALADWAESRRFQFKEVGKNEYHVTSRWSTLIFKKNSSLANINGVAVWLGFPVLESKGEVYISQSDIEKVLQPVLYPPRDKKKKIKTIALSPGHGGKDPGNREGRYLEKEFTLLLAKEVEKLLVRAGFRVVMIRKSDTFVELDQQPEKARRAGADLFISLHYNSAGRGGEGARGVEVFCLTPVGCRSTNGGQLVKNPEPGHPHDEKSVLLGYQLQKSLVKSLDMEDRGLRRARFLVLRETSMPSVLVEAGFMSNPKEMSLIKDGKHRRLTAQAIVDGVLAYKRLVER